MRRWNPCASLWRPREWDGGAWRARISPCGRLYVSCLRHQQKLFGEMAGDLPGAEAAQFWHRGLAHGGAQRTTAIEAADGRIGIDWAARLAGQPQLPTAILVQTRHGRNQRLGIGMQRALEDFRGGGRLDDLGE